MSNRADPPIIEIERAYWAWAEAHKRPRTVEWERDWVWPRYLAHFRPERLGDVSRGQVEAVRRLLAEQWKPASVNGFLRACRSIYNRCSQDVWRGDQPLYTGPNPFAGVRAVPLPPSEMRALSPAEREALLRAAHTVEPDGLYLIVALGVYAGFRLSEIAAARWEWVDWEAGLIRMIPGPAFRPKNGKPRVLPLHPGLRAALQPTRAATGYIVLPAVQGRGRYRFERRRQFRALCDGLGLQGVTPHTLRHTFVSLYLQAGVSMAKVSKWAGHSSVQVTADIYGHLDGYDADIERV